MAASTLVRAYSPTLAMVSRIIDCAMITLGQIIAIWHADTNWASYHGFVAVSACLLMQFFSAFNDLYLSWRIADVANAIFHVVVSWAITLPLVGLLAYFFARGPTNLPSTIWLVWFVNTLILLTMWRIMGRALMSWLRSRGLNTRRVAIVGSGELALAVAESLKNATYSGFVIEGFYDDRAAKRGINSERRRLDHHLHDPDQLRIAGTVNELVLKCEQGDLDAVYVALPMRAEAKIANLVTRLTNSAVSVYIIPDLFMFEILNARTVNIDGMLAISIFENPFMGITGWLKRLEDIILASIILVLISVPMLIVAIGVKISSPGPALFKQMRYGEDGKGIKVWKFRSMRVMEDGGQVKQATKGDARITPFGAFIRRTSLDELPQFFNVLGGSMSIVGPRPHAVAHNEMYRTQIAGYMLRHKIKPGITGWAQVNGFRGETDTLDKMEKRIEYDLHYICNWSVLFDLEIIFMTIFKGFTGKNAY